MSSNFSRLEELAIEAGLLVRHVLRDGTLCTRWTEGDTVSALERFERLVKGRPSISEIRGIQANKITDRGINIVTCGACGEPFVVELKENEHNCPFCEYSSESCDFPDLFH